MKKQWLLLLTSVALLGACQQPADDKAADQSTAQTEEQAKQEATITVQPLEGEAETKQVSFQEGDKVMDVLKANFDVEEDKGFVTSINDVSQDEGNKVFWMYYVNGEMAPKGADQTDLQAGDNVEFKLEKIETGSESEAA
ncbi:MULTISPECIES: DUF4430 domain-containing protein [Aerococcus]|uniref:DUF4430 domain-containing protein n=1 Tax=Aerococcus sanguinicola TaxID=119206 RepID=A0A5N1GMF1_9LACT|nr:MULTISPECIES: DUF4430 domain-containing protein [Aerococcus]KAA9301211.1 DUF4430 domain-containing protein [Aerococcus sanguinicola]MDK6369253.1 DUF4430 domain-containing protein [Aerococcus sp. UMB9870]MDK6679076.1 DUF4430 domain-containing protein [Aerococcus sp. UMB8608]MDK6686984.1 DUF4430 domain-containing protein [Aerococcus sp. UMB8623]MDK6940139.1 DUF4430 domain-containing protein [Aerococcus sp. UMB8487]